MISFLDKILIDQFLYRSKCLSNSFSSIKGYDDILVPLPPVEKNLDSTPPLSNFDSPPVEFRHPPVENARADGRANLHVENVRADGRARLHVENARADGRARSKTLSTPFSTGGVSNSTGGGVENNVFDTPGGQVCIIRNFP